MVGRVFLDPSTTKMMGFQLSPRTLPWRPLFLGRRSYMPFRHRYEIFKVPLPRRSSSVDRTGIAVNTCPPRGRPSINLRICPSPSFGKVFCGIRCLDTFAFTVSATVRRRARRCRVCRSCASGSGLGSGIRSGVRSVPLSPRGSIRRLPISRSRPYCTTIRGDCQDFFDS